MTAETLRGWVRKAEVDDSKRLVALGGTPRVWRTDRVATIGPSD